MDLTVFVDIAKLAGIYLGMALGFVIVYRASRVLNLAQPGLIMLGAFATLTYLPKYDSGPRATPAFWLTALALVAGGAVVGLVVYVALVRPMAGESRVSIVLMTLAVLFLLEAAVEVHWRGERGFMSLPGNQVNYTIFGTHVRLFDLVPLVVGLAMWSGVAAFYKWSKAGIRIRAVAESPALAARRGINIDRIGALSWALAVAVAVVSAFTSGTQGPVSGLLVGSALKGFTVALVGGLDSIGGLLPAALIVAASEVITVRWVDQQWGEAIPFVVLLVVLMIKPWGLAGTVEELERV
ncbi:MAG TPA: branched-chain amino acid ABC transporter permease [Acidimicrobiales bacterium]|nr:branched-chain amino acid ABC transporter permease [Acidimicrobiales bacterium]